MHVYAHVCTQTHTFAGKAVFLYFVVPKFLLLCLRICSISTTDTHIYTQKGTWSKDKSTHSCCSPCKANDPLSFALSSLSLGISSGDMDVGSTFTKSKEKEQCGLQIYVSLSSFSVFPVWPTMRSSRKRNKEKAKTEEVYLYRRKRRIFKIFSIAANRNSFEGKVVSTILVPLE